MKLVFIIFCFILLPLFCFTEDLAHTIQRGDTVYSLSRKYNIPASEIIKYNGLEDASKIWIGQKILIPYVGHTYEAGSKTYTVQMGDTIYGIARKFNIPVGEFMKINELDNSSVIKPGDVLELAASDVKKDIPAVSIEKISSSQLKHKNVLSAQLTASSKTADKSLLWPVYAKKVSYLSGKVSGVVIDSNKGEAVKAIASGKVLSVGTHRGFGQVVFIQSKSKHIYVYGGLDKISVKLGETISLNEKLGRIGLEAFSGSPRLYFMVYEKNKPVDPVKAPRGN